MTTDLSGTLGWKIGPHARSAAQRRGVSPSQILSVIADPELSYPDHGRRIVTKGRLAVVVVPEEQVVVTVLLTGESRWDDQAAREVLMAIA